MASGVAELVGVQGKKYLLDVTSVENKTSSGEVGKISKPPLGLPSPIDGGLHGVP